MSDREDFDAERWVATEFPYDGPHSPESVMDAATAIRELTRYLANAMQSEQAVPYAAITRRMLNSLSSATSMQMQVLGQLADHMDRFTEDVTLYHEETPYTERSGRIDQRAVATLQDAAAQTRKAARALGRAQLETGEAAQVVYPLGND